ncbi:MAG: LacI family DNA-binding transcriptional regulator [Rectinemataceae bacterium]
MITKGVQMGVRVKDIAKLAEVSPAAVSLALNNKPGVGPETRERIIRIARDLGHDGPKQLPTPKAVTELVCFLHIARHGHTVNRDHDVFIADYIEGLGQGARLHGLSLGITTFKATPIETILQSASAMEAAGFIVLGTELEESDVAAFSRLDRPVVFIDTWYDFLPFDFVDMNNEDSVFTIVSDFAERGHRSIGMVKGSIETRNFKLREEGFVASLERLGLDYDPSLVFTVDSTFHGATADMRAILRGGRRLPTALFCANDIIACGCIRAFRHEGVSVPDEVSVIGFDDLPLSAIADPPLTTMQVSKSQIGRMAVQLVSTRIRNGAGTPPVKVLIGGRLVERQSVRDLSATDPRTGARTGVDASIQQGGNP